MVCQQCLKTITRGQQHYVTARSVKIDQITLLELETQQEYHIECLNPYQTIMSITPDITVSITLTT